MPQNGIHALTGMAARRWMPKKEWLVLGMVLGNMFPDLDNIVVAYATLAKLPDPEHFHRTFTHSLFTIVLMVLVFYLVAALTKNEKWKNFGLGFGTGILMHILLDLVLWFNGVELFWPIRYELNFWGWFVMPAWLKIILDTGEFLAFGLYFLLLVSLARRNNLDAKYQGSSQILAYVEFGLFVVFTGLFFAIGIKGLHYSIFAVLYLLSIIIAMAVTVRMRKTVEVGLTLQVHHGSPGQLTRVLICCRVDNNYYLDGRSTMTQSFDPAPRTVQPAVPDRALEMMRTQAALMELKRRIQRGANNFYWIAALSAINSLVLEFGGSAYFVVGLASTLFVDSFAVAVAKDVPDAVIIVKIVGLAISFVLAGIFALFGLFANRGKRWAFITGMILYTLDALLMLVFQEWMGLIFHGIFLFGLFGGLQALNQLQKALPAQPQPADAFPQNIGTS